MAGAERAAEETLTVAPTAAATAGLRVHGATVGGGTSGAGSGRGGETDLRERRGTSSSDEVEESDDGEPVRREVSINLP